MNVKGINKQRNIDVGKDREGLIGLTVGALDKLCSGRQEEDVSFGIYSTHIMSNRFNSYFDNRSNRFNSYHNIMLNRRWSN